MQKHQLLRQFLVFLSFFLLSVMSFAQVTQQWVKRYNGSENDLDAPNSILVDDNGNIYVSGTGSEGATSDDIVTIKYDPNGNVLWLRKYNGIKNLNDRASSLAIDASGNLYITGTTQVEEGDFKNDFITIKYSTSGNELWVRTYNGPDNFSDASSDVAIDNKGNVYITGSSLNTSEQSDYTTIKYDAAGNQLWIKKYNGPANKDDRPVSIAVDANGNVYVTGQSLGNETNLDFATVKYDTNGNELWVKRYNGPLSESDGGIRLVVDTRGNVYVSGNSPGNNFRSDYATIKYDTNGNELWVKRYNGPGNETDDVSSLAVDASGNVYVSGWSQGINTGLDYATIKYDTNGNEMWVRRFNGSDDLAFGDRANELVVDASGNIYVTGEVGSSKPDFDFITIKYDTNGNEIWIKRFNHKSSDFGRSLAVDKNGNVYVTGLSFDNNTRYDIATIKYVQAKGMFVPGYMLVNADTDEDIGELSDGAILNLVTLTSKLNIRALTSPANLGSVVFDLNGPINLKRIENTAPYAALAVNNKNDYNGIILLPGQYTLTATPYSAVNGQGTKGAPLTIRFQVIQQLVNSFTLINADTDQDIKELTDGDVIDLSTFSNTQFNIRANTQPATVGSVLFRGTITPSDPRAPSFEIDHTENTAPYALYANNKGDYFGSALQTGFYTLTATPYSGIQGSGHIGIPYTIRFSVVNSLPITKQAPKLNVDALDKRGSLKASPNPFSGTTTVSFSVPRPGYTTLEVVDINGAVIERLYAAQANGRQVYTLPFANKQLKNGVYALRLISNGYVQSYQLMIRQ